ncbi:MAG TPA: 4Fe-4S single cluster domain-containing protein, partial [Candidatus Ratteibacteria bacterium]|nr:4Fe-4S single cluster domain-containing protein [Candidatus Ratteibacteria bacterium]
KVMNVKEMLSIIDKYSGIEGVTFTGGEPFLQSKELLSLSKLIRCKNLTIVCFTGYQYEDILKGKIPYGKELLNYIDILIDGRFIKEEKTFLIWRGSRNQKVYFLSERYKYLKEFVEKEGISEAEIKVGKKGISITGIFDINFWEELKKVLKEND